MPKKSKDHIPTWSADEAFIVSEIEKNFQELKVILKTKDDPFFLRWWVDYHVQILGERSIIIADNGSQDRSVLDFYKEIEDLTVFSFTGHHNLIHSREKFSTLFEAIRASSRHYIILDTDEFLFALDDDGTSSKILINRIIANLEIGRAAPLPWLNNVRGRHDVFVLHRKESMNSNILFGKPILPSTPPQPHDWGEPIIHNAHVPRHWYGDMKPSGFFVLHLSQYSSEQRIRSNRNKLQARGVVIEGLTDAEVASLDTTLYDDHTIKRLVAEVADHIANPLPDNPSEDVPKNSIRIFQQGKPEYGSSECRSDFEDFIKSYGKIADKLLGAFSERNGSISYQDSDDLRDKLFNQGYSYEYKLDILSIGLVDFPNVLDQYGHPFFRKELIRLLLAHGEFLRAEGFFPIPGSPGGQFWHETLLARAYDHTGDYASAKTLWEKILQREPENQEAKERLS